MLFLYILERNNHMLLTPRNDDPEEVHEKVISPKVVCLGSRVSDSQVVMIKHTGRVVQNVTVELT